MAIVAGRKATEGLIIFAILFFHSQDHPKGANQYIRMRFLGRLVRKIRALSLRISWGPRCLVGGKDSGGKITECQLVRAASFKFVTKSEQQNEVVPGCSN